MLDVQPADQACLICYEESNPPIAVLRGLGCGHIFCDDCWKDHVDTLMLKGDVVNVKQLCCPMHTIGCETRIPHDVIEQVASKRAKQLYDTLVVREFVADHSKVLRWCPGAGCECVVERFRRRMGVEDTATGGGQTNQGSSQSREGSSPSREGSSQSREGSSPSREGSSPSREAMSSVVNFNSVHCAVNLHFFCFECGEGKRSARTIF
jgi:hypothetical protein